MPVKCLYAELANMSAACSPRTFMRSSYNRSQSGAVVRPHLVWSIELLVPDVKVIPFSRSATGILVSVKHKANRRLRSFFGLAEHQQYTLTVNYYVRLIKLPLILTEELRKHL